MAEDSILEHLRALYKADPAVRKAAAHALSEYTMWSDRETLRPYTSHFLVFLTDDLPEVVEVSAFILGELQSREAVPHLLPLVREAGHPAHEEAVTALKRIGNPALPELALLLDDPDEIIQNRAIIMINAINTVQAQRIVSEWILKQNRDQD